MLKDLSILVVSIIAVVAVVAFFVWARNSSQERLDRYYYSNPARG
jgi:nitrogen fixation-related uncharacterized protein